MLIASQRGWKLPKKGLKRITPVEDALAGDEFAKAKTTYEHLKTVTPVFTPQLTAQIQMAIQPYESNIPAAERWLPNSSSAYSSFTHNRSTSDWKTNKEARLKIALQFMHQLPPADTQQEAINQLACVLHTVENLALERARSASAGSLYLDPKPLRLTEPVQEMVQGQPIQVSYGIRHVTLFHPHGGIQVQCLPEHLQGVDYRKRAATGQVVIFDKPGLRGEPFWN